MAEVKDGQFGIIETEECLDFIIPLAETIDETTQTKFRIEKLIKFVAPLSKLPAAIKGGNLVIRELGDLSDMERQKLYDKIVTLGFVQERAERIGEKSFRALIALGELAVEIADAKKER